ncbi:MAG TPA: MMPL family transporter [Pseudolysinimonas sp.]|nr:MMPL family transporter [Pseudolysinimonas sp.]
MATLLYRLGRFATRRAVPVLIAWFLIAAGVLVGGFALGGQMEDSFSIPGTESQTAIDRLDAVFPQAGGGSAEIVVAGPHGASLERAEGARNAEVVTSLGKVSGVEQAVSPYSTYATDAVSADGSTAIISVQFTKSSENVSDATLAAVRAAADPLTADGLTVAFGGQVFQKTDIGISIIEVFGLIFAAVVLIVTFGSLLAAGLPLLSAIVALGVSMGVVITASAFTTLSTATPMLALMIGLAVGIDYALFILSRHRSQLAAGMEPRESIATAVATAGSSVVFAGLTVVIALAGLLVVGVPFLGLMGVAAAVSVVLAMLAATTLLPAVLGLLGRRLTPRAPRVKRRPSLASAAAAAPAAVSAVGETTAPRAKKTLGQRWVQLVLKAPIVAVVLVVGLLGALALPAAGLKLALPDGGQQTAGSTARVAYDLVSEKFGPGRNGPLVIAVDITQTTSFQKDLASIADELKALPGVKSVSAGTPNATLDTAIIQVIPTTGPSDAKTTDLVTRIRALEPSIQKQYDTPIAVTGSTAVAIDVSDRLDSALLPFGLIVVGLSVILLMVVFRSILVPIKAALGYLLSVLAAFGVVVAVFQWGWGADLLGVTPGPILSFMPILLMAILFGLAMDYEVFLVSGMREAYVHGRHDDPDAPPRKVAQRAVVTGFSGAARVVTAAALIMFFVFASFVPSGSSVIKPIALGLAVGIAADAFLVRMTLVPAVMALAGRAAWYLPKWLDRILPNVDLEGSGLRAHLADAAWARQRADDGEAITLDRLVAADPDAVPVSLSVPAGSIALADVLPSRMLGATVAGRLAPRSGRAQVAGRAVPSESSRVAALVAITDLAGPVRSEIGVTVGDLLEERLRLTAPWYRAFRARRRARAWLARIAGVLGRPLAADAVLASLPQLDRAVALAAIALAERTPVVLLDSVDPFSGPDETRAFLRALDRLAPATTTVVVAMPGVSAASGAAARIHPLALSEGAIR